jgi:N-acetylmuramoyl-L-alanine amidase
MMVLALAAKQAAPAVAANPGEVTGVRLGEDGNSVRIVLETTAKFPISHLVLVRPNRVVLDMPEVRWRMEPVAQQLGKGFVSGYRFGRFSAGRARMVFDLSAPAQVTKRFFLRPMGGRSWRFVIDLAMGAKTGPATQTAAGPTRTPSYGNTAGGQRNARPQPRPSSRAGVRITRPLVRPVGSRPIPGVNQARPGIRLTPPATRRPGISPRPPRRMVIMIDPGHGGIDPGTVGRRKGVYEKHITLAMAHQLKAELSKRRHFRVAMTRRKDIFVRLRARIAKARAAGADLFISLHADALADRSVRGASVYTLSERASDKEAAGLAAKENKADLIAGIDLSRESEQVTNILIDLAQRETMNHSVRFAKLLIAEVRKRTRFLRKSHRFGGFAVLKSPDVPSVLLEMGYLSNSFDEGRLTKPRYRARLAQAIAKAVDGYFAKSPLTAGR